MKLTLGQLVEGALSEADEQLKLASAADARTFATGDLYKIAEDSSDEYYVNDEDDDDEDDDDEDVMKRKKKKEEENEKISALSDASHAQDLVEALGHISIMWDKVASALPVMAGGMNVGDTTKDSPTSAATVPAAQASHGGSTKLEAVDGGPANNVETNKAGYASPDWTKNPEAQKGVARTSGVHPGETPAKTASLRNILAHQAGLLEAAGAKIAQDPSSPQPVGITTVTDPGKLNMVPSASTAIPDNATLRQMTKRKALTKQVKGDAAKFLSEPAFSAYTDKGLSDNLSMGLETAKIASSLVERLESTQDPNRLHRNYKEMRRGLAANKEDLQRQLKDNPTGFLGSLRHSLRQKSLKAHDRDIATIDDAIKRQAARMKTSAARAVIKQAAAEKRAFRRGSALVRRMRDQASRAASNATPMVAPAKKFKVPTAPGQMSADAKRSLAARYLPA